MSKVSNFYRESVVFIVGSVSVLTTGVQPIILGGLAHDSRLSVNEMGFSAMVELLALGLSCGLAAAKLNPSRLRTIVVLACLVHAGITLTCTRFSGTALVALRGCAGIAEGLMLWMIICMIMRTRDAARYTGIFAVVQTISQAGMAAFLSTFIMPGFGTNGAFLALSIVSIVCAGLAVTGPKGYAALPKLAQTHHHSIWLLPYLGLISVFLYNAYIVGVWIYLEPLGMLSGLSLQAAGELIAAALVAQVVGGIAGTMIAPRLPTKTTLLLVGTGNLIVIAMIVAKPSATVFIACALMLGFLWMFISPFHTQLLIDVDPSRRIAMQLGSAQLLGASFGPLVASLFVGEHVNAILPICAVMLASSMALIGMLRAGRSVDGAGAISSPDITQPEILASETRG